MKKILLILILILTACSAAKTVNAAFATPVPISTLAPAVCQYLATQEAQCNPTTATPAPTTPATASPTPNPTITPTSTPMAKFDPYDYDNIPALGVYEVGPLNNLPGTINSLDIYTSARLPNNFYPATYFPMYQELGKAALDFQYCPDNIVNVLLTKLDSDWAYKYLNSYPDGENFSAGFRTVIYPSTPERINTVQTIARKTFKAPGSVGQWWFQIATIKCDFSTMEQIAAEPSIIPDYEINAQSDMTHNGALTDGQLLMGHEEALMPIIASNPVWVQASQLLNVQVQP